MFAITVRFGLEIGSMTKRVDPWGLHLHLVKMGPM